MAWYAIHHTCGHNTQKQIYGTDVRGARQHQADRLGQQPCPDCQHTTRNAAAAELATAQGLPTLTGSDKQTAWATTIRATAIQELDRHRRQITTVATQDPTQADAAHAILSALDAAIAQHTDARWWIDNRHAASTTLMSDAKVTARQALAAR